MENQEHILTPEEKAKIEAEERLRHEVRQQFSQSENISQKSRLVTVVLAFFLGCLGIHRFYLGKTGTGVLMLLTGGGFGFWWIIDFLVALFGGMTDGKGLVVSNW